jgi:type VI secretion system protein VasD
VPISVMTSVTADKQLNPDQRGRSSPVLVRVYELKNGAGFQNADFLSLFERDQATLGSDLIHREEYLMKPGESKSWSRKADVDARILAVFVAYRDLEHSVWRASVPLPEAKEVRSLLGKGIFDVFAETPFTRYSISVGARAVQIRPSNN